MNDHRKPAVGYVRMSTDQQQDSPARQRQDIETLASRQGFRIIRWYEDHGQTGTESSKRKEFQKLLGDAKAGTFQAVLLSEQSRMSREDIFDAMQHWRKFRDAGVSIITCQRGELKFDNLGGVITAIVDQYGAREESLKLADRVVSGKRLAISRGQRQGGFILGYDREISDEQGKAIRRVCGTETFQKPITWRTRLVPALDPKAVEAVRFMFEQVASGVPVGTVARELNRRGFPTLFGKRFSSSVVKRVVSNPVYTGRLVAGRERRGKFRSIHDDGGITCENAHEALVSIETFEKVQKALAVRRIVPKSSTPGRHLLTGIIFEVGSGRRLQGATMSHSNRKTVRRFYTYPPSYFEQYPEESDRPTFRADTIERAVLAKLQTVLTNARNLRAIRTSIIKRKKTVAVNTGRIESQLASLRIKIEKATENLALADRADIPGITRLLAGWREQESSLREKLQREQGDVGVTPEALAIIEKLDQLIGNLAEANREKLAYAIRQTVKRISLRRERRGTGRHRIVMWDGVIELRDDLGIETVIPLTDDDIPSPGKWREVAGFVLNHGGTVYLGDVADGLSIHRTNASFRLLQSVLAGKIVNLGHQKGWTAIK